MSDIKIEGMHQTSEIAGVNSVQSTEMQDDISLFKNDIPKTEPDGIIGDFSQGSLGDCGLLATFISIANSEKSSEIFKNAIFKTNNGYGVYFKGLNKAYEISQDELNSALKGGYALGLRGDENPDSDVILMELAFEKACDENSSPRMKFKKFFKGDYYKDKKSIESEDISHFMKLLTGEKSSYKINWLNLGLGNNRLLNKLQNKDFLACANFSTSSKDKVIQTQDGPYTISTPGVGHAYSIKSVDDENVTLVNPHYPDKDIVISRKDFSKNVNEIHYLIFN